MPNTAAPFPAISIEIKPIAGATIDEFFVQAYQFVQRMGIGYAYFKWNEYACTVYYQGHGHAHAPTDSIDPSFNWQSGKGFTEIKPIRDRE
jgi:hypothetical protein